MRSRITPASFNSIPAPIRTLCDEYINQQLNARWKALQGLVGERVVYALALALNDRYGWKETGIVNVINALYEILDGYNEETYTPKDARREFKGVDDVTGIADLAESMRLELESRGIKIKFDNNKNEG